MRLDGPQPPERVVHILRQVAGSLEEAHKIGLIHRDIKPANVILVAEHGGAIDVAKVVDFGLVKDLDRRAQANLTLDSWMVGTPHYLSPEAISSPDGIGPASDLYSLACVAYFLLTGHTVFEGGSVIEICSPHLNSLPTPLAERLGRPLPESISALVHACLEKDATRRPASARALRAALDACADTGAWSEAAAREWWVGLSARNGHSRRSGEPAAGVSCIQRALEGVGAQAPR